MIHMCTTLRDPTRCGGGVGDVLCGPLPLPKPQGSIEHIASISSLGGTPGRRCLSYTVAEAGHGSIEDF